MHKQFVGTRLHQPPPTFLILLQPDLSRAPARIFRRQAPGTSGRARATEWVLQFERQRPDFLDPFMGWTGGVDPQAPVELTFGSRSEAIGYAERQGLTWRVVEEDVIAPSRIGRTQAEAEGGEHSFEPVTGPVAWWSSVRDTDGRCRLDLDRALVNPASVFAAPDDVIIHPLLTIDCKREILWRWAWDEYLLDLALADGMPEGEPSRLPEVRAALRLLGTEWSPDPAAPAAFVARYEQLDMPLAA